MPSHYQPWLSWETDAKTGTAAGKHRQTNAQAQTQAQAIVQFKRTNTGSHRHSRWYRLSGTGTHGCKLRVGWTGSSGKGSYKGSGSGAGPNANSGTASVTGWHRCFLRYWPRYRFTQVQAQLQVYTGAGSGTGSSAGSGRDTNTDIDSITDTNPDTDSDSNTDNVQVFTDKDRCIDSNTDTF